MSEYYQQKSMLREYRKIAYYYYKEKLSQAEIASIMNTSRQRINRILQKCEELGIVKIEISDPDHDVQFETRLAGKYKLREVRIVRPIDDSTLIEDIGNAGAKYLEELMKRGSIIGFSRGRTAAALVNRFLSFSEENWTVTQLMGNSINADNRNSANIETDSIVHRFAEKTGATINRLNAPIIVRDKKLKEYLQQEPSFVRAYHVIKNCDIAVVGIGTVQIHSDYMREFISELTDEEVHMFAHDAVGEVCTHFYDAEGNEIGKNLRDRIIAIEEKDLKSIPLRIGVAGGKGKTAAIRGAIYGGYINALVTDTSTAEALLD